MLWHHPTTPDVGLWSSTVCFHFCKLSLWPRLYRQSFDKHLNFSNVHIPYQIALISNLEFAGLKRRIKLWYSCHVYEDLFEGLWQVDQSTKGRSHFPLAIGDLEKALLTAYKEADSRQLTAPFSQEEKSVLLSCLVVFVLFFHYFVCTEKAPTCAYIWECLGKFPREGKFGQVLQRVAVLWFISGEVRTK